MRFLFISGSMLLALLLSGIQPSAVAEQIDGFEVDAKQVREAIDRGVQYLRNVEKGRGDWEVHGGERLARPGGWTSLAMLALLNCGVKVEDPMIQRGLKYLRGLPPKHTYVVGLQTMVFAAARQEKDLELIQRNVDWLVKAMVYNGGRFMGWTYSDDKKFGPTADNSNTQYALLGLHEGQLAGAKIDKRIWKEIRDFYVDTQRPDGGWGYANYDNNGSILTMTTAGVCGLLIAGMEVKAGRESLRDDGTAFNCGKYDENGPVAMGLRWIGAHFTVENRRALYYNLYGLERTGRLTGLRHLGRADWYREGCKFLVRAQKRGDDRENGSWVSPLGSFDSWPVVSTSFALLFLSKGRTPILISKLAHGPGEDWNNDHNDARHLVEYCSREMFKRTPLAWQIFDAKQDLIVVNRDEVLRVVGDLMQSPVAYFNGHRAPKFTEVEESILKEYIEQGGFILAEACCGRPEFDAGFRNLMKRLFPDTPLRPLDAKHPIWRAHSLVRPGAFRLEGIEMGCKTVVVYSPNDLSCLWESNKLDSPQVQLAFRLGANIIAYATGLELPKPRLTPPEIVKDDPKAQNIPRGFLKVAQLRHDGDWQPAPKAMRNLMANLHEKTQLLVTLKTEAIHPSQRDLLEYRFLYMHGRNQFAFASGGVNANEVPALANLKADLQTGGLLFADACCGRKAFDASFRELMTQLFPDKKLERIPLDDVLFGKELNGEAITKVRCRRAKSDEDDAKGDPAEFREVDPYLEGIKLNNRWVVIYSKYDIGCALEKHQSTDCQGHDHESALRLGTAVVLYALNR
jgi:hypothetical protein